MPASFMPRSARGDAISMMGNTGGRTGLGAGDKSICRHGELETPVVACAGLKPGEEV